MQNNKMPLVHLENIVKDYQLGRVKVPALRGISLSIEAGEFVAIAGPSGSGKTTLLNLLGCLDKPSSGTLSFRGEEISHLPNSALADLRKYHLGFIFQTFNLIPVLTAFENIEFPLIILGHHNSEQRRQKVKELLQAVGLDKLADRRPAELSGGQQQRVAIARALIKNPQMVLADEPTANLDSTTAGEILSLMQKMNQQTGTTFIFSTHDPLVMSYARRLIKLHDGHLASDEKQSTMLSTKPS